MWAQTDCIMSAPAVASDRTESLRPLPSKADALAKHATNTQTPLSSLTDMTTQQHRENDADDTEEEYDEEEEEGAGSGQEELDEDEVLYGAAGANLLNLDADAWDDTALIQLWDQHVKLYKVNKQATQASRTALRSLTDKQLTPRLIVRCVCCEQEAHGQLSLPAAEEQDESKEEEEATGSTRINGEVSRMNGATSIHAPRTAGVQQQPAWEQQRRQAESPASSSKSQRRNGIKRKETQSAADHSPPPFSATPSAPPTTGVPAQSVDPWAAWYQYYYSQQQQQQHQPYATPQYTPALSYPQPAYPHMAAPLAASPPAPPSFASASTASAQSAVHTAAASLARSGSSDESLAQLLTAWYYSGYYTGRYQAMQETQTQRR